MNRKIESIQGLRMRFVVVLVTAFAAVSATSVSVAAASGPAGFVGACNMLHAGTSMTDIAMVHDNPHGNEGMFTAVVASGCIP
jgi:hypothetical protein